MLIALLIIVGFILGAASADIEGAFLGAFIGFLFARVLQLSERIDALNDKIKQLPVVDLSLDLDDDVAISQTPAQATKAKSTDNEHIVDKPTVSSQPAWASAPPAYSTETLYEPALPDWMDKGWAYIKRYFTEGNVPVRIGVVILFFGVGFALEYARTMGMVPIEFRLMGFCLLGLALLVFGWRLRNSKPSYALAVQGGAIGILYLTLFATFKFYQILPAALIFPLLIGLAAFSSMLAILQDSKALAVLGIAGGFLAPVLTSTGEGSHIMLFSYYTILNLGILAIAWFKSWRLLNLVGFVFTFVIGSAWGFARYQQELFLSTEFFLGLFFIFYVLISILFAYKQPPKLKGYVDGTIVFGTPLICFALQSGLIQHIEFGVAISSAVLGFFYLCLASLLFAWRKETMRGLAEAQLSLGVVFASLAIPMAFDGHVTAAFWSLEGSAILWIAIRQQRLLAKIFSLLLIVGAGLLFLIQNSISTADLAILNSGFLGGVLVSIAGLFSAYYLHQHYKEKSDSWEFSISIGLLVWGLCWWFGNGFTEINAFTPQVYKVSVYAAFIALSFIVLSFLHQRLNWTQLRHAPILFTIMLVVLGSQALDTLAHPSVGYGYLAWPLAFMINYWVLWRHEIQDKKYHALPILHGISSWLIIILASVELSWHMRIWIEVETVWTALTWIIVPLLSLAMALKFKLWPIRVQEHKYLTLASIPVVLYLLFWSVTVNLSSNGEAWLIAYVPILNPLDIAQMIVFLSLMFWWLKAGKLAPLNNIDTRFVYAGFSLLIFYWLNMGLLRSLHHGFDIPFDLDVMLQSDIVQTALSIFWTALSMFIMIVSSKKGLRIAWLVAAALLAIVVLKLFFIDLSSTDGLERIISFLGVGGLLLVVGYFSPIPPSNAAGSENDSGSRT